MAPAIASILWFVASVWTARRMYQRWRPGIIQRGTGGWYGFEMASDNPEARCVWAAIFSIFISLTAWWCVLLVMAVMAKPPKTPEEIKADKKAQRKETEQLEAEAEQLRRQLKKYREDNGLHE